MKDNTMLSIDKMKQVIKKYDKRLLILTITGGEPFINTKHLLELIESLKSRNPWLYYISINTNAYFPEDLSNFINLLLQKHNLKLYIGVSYLPNKNWASERTGIIDAYDKYQASLNKLADLKSIYGPRLQYYKIFTIESVEDLELCKSIEDDVWLNFAEISDFYNNKYLDEFNIESAKKINALSNYLKSNKQLSIANRVFIKKQLNIFKRAKRNYPCYAGINRIYLDEYGKIFVCSRGKENLPINLNDKLCCDCWTSCEAVFDIIQK